MHQKGRAQKEKGSEREKGSKSEDHRSERKSSPAKSHKLLYSFLAVLIAFSAYLVITHMKKAIQHDKSDIVAFNQHYQGDAASAKTQDQTSTADIFYNIVTDFYEWGWGPSFHFATRHSQETFRESLRRHEYYLSNKLQLKPGMTVLDMGSGKIFSSI